VIRATVPAKLEYRDLAIRLVASACKLMPGRGREFADQVVSAFSEALNNIVLHGGEPEVMEVEISLEPLKDRLVIQLVDHGRSFDPRTAPAPDLDALPEGGMGAFIMRSFMDEITYVVGPPNTLTMTKYLRG
jgi:serine/threonine-protein kinase RsbW